MATSNKREEDLGMIRGVATAIRYAAKIVILQKRGWGTIKNG